MSADKVYGKKNYRRMKDLLEKRVTEPRFKHSKGVAKTAQQLAKVYGYDEKKARMAGLVHDWDKGLSFDECRQRVKDYAIDIDPRVVDQMPWLLHGPTAAAVLKDEFPELGDDVFQAIARHTSGSADMAPLDSIIFIADILEPNRRNAYDWQHEFLRGKIGAVDLDELYFLCFKDTFSTLIKLDRRLYPGMTDIWNDLMKKYGRSIKGERYNHDAKSK